VRGRQFDRLRGGAIGYRILSLDFGLCHHVGKRKGENHEKAKLRARQKPQGEGTNGVITQPTKRMKR